MYNRHGYSKSGQRHPLYVVWRCMKQRCHNASNDHFHYYGGRGITVCGEWIDDPKTFIEWGLTNGWKPGLTIDRRDNDAGYSPGNCRFVTQAVNNKNQRPHKPRKKDSSLPPGVTRRGKRFEARISIGGKRRCLGRFDTPEDASNVYQSARLSKRM